MAMTTKHQKTKTITMMVFLILISVAMIIPFYWMVVLSFKPIQRLFVELSKITPGPFTLQSYMKVFAETPFLRWMFNSVVITVGFTVLALILTTLGGFALAKYKFFLSNPLLILIILTLTLPIQVLIIPLFIMMVKLRLLNTYIAVIIPFSASPFGIFYIRQYISSSIPTSLLDAARIDGCSEFALFYRIVVPNIKHGIAVLAIIFTLTSWNNFLWPLIALRSDKMYPVTLGLSAFMSPLDPKWDIQLAGSVLATLPIIMLFLLMQRQFISAFTTSGIK